MSKVEVPSPESELTQQIVASKNATVNYEDLNEGEKNDQKRYGHLINKFKLDLQSLLGSVDLSENRFGPRAFFLGDIDAIVNKFIIEITQVVGEYKPVLFTQEISKRLLEVIEQIKSTLKTIEREETERLGSSEKTNGDRETFNSNFLLVTERVNASLDKLQNFSSEKLWVKTGVIDPDDVIKNIRELAETATTDRGQDQQKEQSRRERHELFVEIRSALGEFMVSEINGFTNAYEQIFLLLSKTPSDQKIDLPDDLIQKFFDSQRIHVDLDATGAISRIKEIVKTHNSLVDFYKDMKGQGSRVDEAVYQQVYKQLYPEATKLPVFNGRIVRESPMVSIIILCSNRDEYKKLVRDNSAGFAFANRFDLIANSRKYSIPVTVVMDSRSLDVLGDDFDAETAKTIDHEQRHIEANFLSIPEDLSYINNWFKDVSDGEAKTKREQIFKELALLLRDELQSFLSGDKLLTSEIKKILEEGYLPEFFKVIGTNADAKVWEKISEQMIADLASLTGFLLKKMGQDADAKQKIATFISFASFSEMRAMRRYIMFDKNTEGESSELIIEELSLAGVLRALEASKTDFGGKKLSDVLDSKELEFVQRKFKIQSQQEATDVVKLIKKLLEKNIDLSDVEINYFYMNILRRIPNKGVNLISFLNSAR